MQNIKNILEGQAMLSPTTRTGGLIVFSGLDGAGKSTQINLMRDWLDQKGLKSRLLWTRGGYTPGIEALKDFLRTFSGGKAVPASGPSAERDRALERRWVRKLWLTLALFDLIFIYGLVIRWWKWRGEIIICDRYLWDTGVDFQLNFPSERAQDWLLWRILERFTPCSDLSFLMLVPVEESILRSDKKGEPFRDSAETLAQRASAYQKLAPNGHWKVLDGLRDKDELAEEIRGLLKSRMYAN